MSTKISGITIPIEGNIDSFLKSMKKVDTEINKTGKTVDSLKKSLELEWDDARFIETQKQAQKAINDSTDKIRLMKVEFDRLESSGQINTTQFKTLQEEILKSESNLVLLKRRMQEINDLKIQQIANQFKTVGDSISQAGQKLMALSAASAAALAGMTALFNTTVTSAAEIDDLSQSINLNAEAIQRWRYISKQLGLDNGTLTTALSKTQAAFAGMAMGEINASTEALKRLGFTTEQASMGMDVNFEIMIQKLSQVTDATEQAYLANELFGDRLGSKVIPLLKGGADGLTQLSDEFEAIGYMSNDQVKALAEYDDQWNVVKQSFIEIKNQLAISLLPLFQQLTSFIQDKVVPVVRTLAEWFGGLSTGTKSTVAVIMGIVSALAPVLMIVGKLVSSLGPLISGVSKLNGLLGAVAGVPVIGWIIGIIAVISALYATNEKFRESINNLAKTLMSALMPILGIVGDLLGTLFQAIMPLVSAIGNVLAPLITNISNVLSPLIQVLSVLLIPLMNSLKISITVLQVQLAPLIWLLKGLGTVMMWLTEQFRLFMNKMIDETLNPLLVHIEGFVNKAIDLINGLIDSINSIGGALGINISKLDKVKLQLQTNPGAPVKTGNTTNNASTVNKTIDNAVANTIVNNNVTTTTNYDNSNRNIQVDVVIQNYAEQIDVKDLTRRINLELAKQM